MGIKKTSLIALLGLIGVCSGASVPAAPAPGGRGGPVRAEGRAVADAGGPFNALGATLFWGAWGYRFERARLERNLATLAAAGVDYVRVLGSVGGRSWEDRETDPRWDDYDDVIAGLTDLAYDTYGLRVQWTIFGGAPFTPPGRAREALVDRFAAMARGREAKLFAFEIANEGRSTGFDGASGIAELRRLGERLNARTPVLVALSDPASGAECETYAGAVVDAVTMHYERGFARGGPLRPLLRPWDFPRRYDERCRGELPGLVFNNEPIGPESSVRADADPGRIAAGYALTFLAGHAAYVLHAGPGIRGGGDADLARSPPRHANFDELPAFAPVADALRAAKRHLPAGLANWTRAGPNDANRPIQGYDRIYAAVARDRFVALVVGVERPLEVRARVASTIVVRQAATGRVIDRLTPGAGEVFRLPAGQPLLLLGTR